MKTRKMGISIEKTVHILTWIFFVPFSIGVFVILGASFCTTIYYDLYQGADLPRFGHENILVLLLASIVILFIFYELWRKNFSLFRKGRGDQRVIKVAMVWAFVVCMFLILMVRGIATNDALTLDGIINAFMKGDFSSLTTEGEYLFIYPFQIGYVALGQLIAVLFGTSNYLVFQLLNVISIILTIWSLFEISIELFDDKRIADLMAVLSMGMFFLFMYADFVYNDIITIAPTALAMLFVIRYLKCRSAKYILYSGILTGIAIVLKSNIYIALVAIVILMILDAVKSNNQIQGIAKEIILALVMIIIAKGMLFVVEYSYSKAAGLSEYPQGTTALAYVAMGLQEGDGEAGWYNGYNCGIYGACGFDKEETNKAAMANIQETLADFARRPLHACRFFLRKYLTQWADPTCISMRNLELTSRHVEGQPKIMTWLIYGSGRTMISWIMNVFQFICYLGVSIYCISVFKKKKFEFTHALLILYIFGGMIFHEFWEGSSRYALRYEVFMLPFAAAGLSILFSLFDNKLVCRKELE